LLNYNRTLHKNHASTAMLCRVPSVFRTASTSATKIKFQSNLALAPVDLRALKLKATAEDNYVWQQLFAQCQDYWHKVAHPEHVGAVQQLLKDGIYCKQELPHIHNVSEYLSETVGWSLVVVDGTVSSRMFLEQIANRSLPITNKVRDHRNVMFTPEPDVCHELLGHVPLLLESSYAEFVQRLALESVSQSDEKVREMERLYWWTAEMGVCWHQDTLRAYGAAILSSPQEMRNVLDAQSTGKHGTASLLKFDFDVVTQTSYSDQDTQSKYFALQSWSDLNSCTPKTKMDLDVYDSLGPAPFPVSTARISNSTLASSRVRFEPE